MISSELGRVKLEGTKSTILTDFTMIVKGLLADDFATIEEIEDCVKAAQKPTEEIWQEVVKHLEKLLDRLYEDE